MIEQKPPNFFDKNTILAILLSFGIFLGWQQYIQKKYPEAYTQDVTTTAGAKEDNQGTSSTQTAEKPPSASAATAEIKEATNVEAQKVPFKTETMDFEVSQQGMAISNLQLHAYKRRNGDPIIYKLPVQQIFVDGRTNFTLDKTSDFEITGTQQNPDSVTRVVYKIDPEKYLLTTKISVANTAKKTTVVEALSKYEILPTPSSFLLPPTDHQEFFISSNGKINREKVVEDAGLNNTAQSVTTAAYNTQYFAQAFINLSALPPEVTTIAKDKEASLNLKFVSAQPVDTLEVEFSSYFGPKKEELLNAVDPSLVDMIDYGIFSVIGRPMHTAMLYIYTLVGNWGVAIILITLILRTLILPAGVYSFRSMKKMQKIQPKLQAIKEKYKNDAQKANQETLLLLKSEKANPLSGCIPALLQLPIFIAFFSMMSCSFELYMQPFYFWIYDLSSKDPYYVFPILAGAAMFFQMQMTPVTTTDPAQAKIMKFMPLLFTVFMLSTPSGLALYMFVGSIFSIFQQIMFMKEKTT
jgi:YidC/Oxa1 family membrane protein insertase